MSSACPDDDTLAAVLAGRASGTLREQVARHADSCDSCGALLGCAIGEVGGESTKLATPDSVAAAEGLAAAGGPLAPGAALDGYRLRRRLAAGGMGEVWIADDPELDRQVAIKVLLPDRGTDTGVLRAEARSLAQLSHPNVVTVHGMGWAGGRDYIAMEYVAGMTLAEWAKREASLSERLEQVVAAGRGLAAAHRAGVVHRDFKPSNVLLGADGQVKVGDFGLARQVDVGRAVAGLASGTTLTAVAGTPLYMAPEQLRGGRATEAGDQYSYAASVYEVVYGTRPYTGASVKELATRIEAGPPPPPARGRRGPGWLRAVILRGLSAEPARRYPSVEAMVEALARGQQRRRRLRATALLAGVAGVSGLAVAAFAGGSGPRCEGVGDEAAEVWRSKRAAAVDARLASLAVAAEPSAPATAYIAGYVERWRGARRAVCRATAVEGTQSPALLDRRNACLDDGLRQLDATLRAIEAAPDRPALAAAAAAAYQLPSPEECAASERVALAPPRPTSPRALAALEALEAQQSRLEALARVGRFLEVGDATRDLLEQAERVGYPPALAAARRNHAAVLSELGRRDEAVPLLRAIVESAGAFRDPMVEAEAGVELVRIIGVEQGKIDEALALVPFVLAARSRLGRPMALGMVDVRLASVYNEAGRYEEALERARMAEQSFGRAGEVAQLERSSALFAAGRALRELDRMAEARGVLEQAVEIVTARAGEAHPVAQAAFNELGLVAHAQNRYDAAVEWFERSIASARAAFGEGSEKEALAYGNLGNIAQHRGQQELALEHFGAAMRIMEQTGASAARRALTLNNLGNVYYAMGKFSEARDHWHRSLELKRMSYGEGHPVLASSMINLGLVVVAEGDASLAADAEQQCSDALAIWRRTLPARHYSLHHALGCIGQARLLDGRPGAALAPLEEAWALHQQPGSRDAERAGVAFHLARALDAAGREPARVRELAALARRLYVEAGEPYAERVAAVDEALGVRVRGD